MLSCHNSSTAGERQSTGPTCQFCAVHASLRGWLEAVNSKILCIYKSSSGAGLHKSSGWPLQSHELTFIINIHPADTISTARVSMVVLRCLAAAIAHAGHTRPGCSERASSNAVVAALSGLSRSALVQQKHVCGVRDAQLLVLQASIASEQTANRAWLSMSSKCEPPCHCGKEH